MIRAVAVGILALTAASPAWAENGWRPIFNGKNLDGWTPKINHHPAGENWRNTFRVEEGVLKVSYAEYDRFTDEYAHLIYNRRLSSYRIRLEYRFTGPPPPGAQPWAVRNSGVMLHGQAPQAMALDQPYPVSIEAQLIGGNTPGETRPTGNLCTPGTTVTMQGRPVTEHCTTATTAPTFQDGEWVRFEVEVHGGRLVRQFVNGVKVMEYGDIHLAPSEYRRFANIDPGDAKTVPLTSGYISLQGESSPVEFRHVELKLLRH